MIIKHVTQLGNPVIRKKSKLVKNPGSKKIKQIVRDLTDSMRFHNLVGMAAPQIGINTRIFVSEIRQTKFRKPKYADGLRVFVNPKIISLSGRIISEYEGCGSVASSGLIGLVPRNDKVKVRASDENGKHFTMEAKGLLARIIQHEHDHLEGKIFLDRVKNTKNLMSQEEYIKRY